ncbi:MAG: rod-binding protein [Campylobacterales bacterium]|nr:rod-binding protein [Campylobacterales bacterium]
MGTSGMDSLNIYTQTDMQPNLPKINPRTEQKINGSNGDLKAENKALREQTDAFESVILKMVMDNSMKDEKNLFSAQKDPGDEIYKSMYRDELSKASAGSFGFSQMLYDFLSRKS